jgi:murein DD-endopeptidase MepM/ murein hydrolase activator NlpD
MHRYNMKIKNLALLLVCFLTACTTDRSGPVVVENNQSIYYGKKSKLKFIEIQEEQSVSDIAKNYKVPIKEITRLNALNSYDIVRVGQVIKMPLGSYYLVRENDTLENVARVNDVDLKVLAQANHLSVTSEIRTGDYIKIPETTSAFVESKEYSPVDFESSEIHNPEQPLDENQPPIEAQQQQLEGAQLPNQDQKESNVTEESIPTTVAESYLDPKRAKVANTTSGTEVKKSRGPKDLGALTAKNSVSVAPQPTKPVQFFKNKMPLNSQEFIWPVEGKVMKPYGNGNDGINIAAAKGTPIKATAGGDVAYAGAQEGYGNLVILKHNEGYMSAYAHLDKILVKKGQLVSKGVQIGTVGTSGNVLQTQPQLKFSMKKGNATINPDG